MDRRMRREPGKTTLGPIAGLFLALLAASCGGSGAAPAASTVTGTLVDTAGVPLPGSIVSLPGTPVEAGTDDAGRFSFTVDAGRYSLVATRDGAELLRTTFEVGTAQTRDLGNLEPSFPYFAPEVWPTYTPGAGDIALAGQSAAAYRAGGYSYLPYLQEYQPQGDYLNFGSAVAFRESDQIRFDADGVPMVKYGEGFFYNPVTVSQYALHRYGRYLLQQEDLSNFLAAVERLLAMQDDTGAFRYPFPFLYYLTGRTYQPGWVSGMAQGQALSALSRAWRATGDPRYLAAGDAALRFLLVPVSEGGTRSSLADLHPTLWQYTTFEEYPAEPASYTLNGFMFTLLGLYDWWQIDPQDPSGAQAVAGEYFAGGIDSVTRMLPYYDLGGFTAYDLGHIVYGAGPHVMVNYHAIHIYLLHALHSVTGEPLLQQYEALWASYVASPSAAPPQ